MEVNKQTYRNYQWLIVLHCVDCNPHNTIGSSVAAPLARGKHHFDTISRRFIGIQNLSLGQ